MPESKSFLKRNSIRDYETLDAIVVVGSLVLVAGIVFGCFMRPPTSEVLPVISSLATAILGLPIAYGAFRWGNNVGAKAATEAAAENSKVATAAVAQAAGANVATTVDQATINADSATVVTDGKREDQ